MIGRRLLYLNTHRLSAYAWQGGSLRPEAVFEGNDDGLRQFAEYLAWHKHSHYSLLANVAEEGHALESIPFLQGSDRRTLIARKLSQHFQGTPLTAATSLGFEKVRRKNEKLLLSALTNPAHFDPWLQRLTQAEIALAGIFSIAQLGGALLRKLGLGSGRCLLLSMQDHSIRESFLVDGQLHFSRMAPLTDSSIVGIANSFSKEAGKLHQYLIGQRLIGRNEALPVFVIAHPQSIPAIEIACTDRGQLAFNIIDSHQAASQVGLKARPEDNRCDLLFLHLLATNPPQQQFATVPHRHHHRLAQIRYGLMATGFVALLGGALFAARQTYFAHQLRQEAAATLAGETDMNRRYQVLSASFPQLGIDNELLRRLTSRYGELASEHRLPEPAYRQLGSLLDRMPAISLEEIVWKNGQTLTATAKSSDNPGEVTTVRGAIRLERASIRQTLDVFDQFVAALRSDPTVSVRILQRPFDIDSGAALRGGDGQEAETGPRQFTVEIVRGSQS